jgi:hypothetical protein
MTKLIVAFRNFAKAFKIFHLLLLSINPLTDKSNFEKKNTHIYIYGNVAPALKTSTTTLELWGRGAIFSYYETGSDGGKRSIRRDTCCSAILSTTNPTWTALGKTTHS